MVLFCFISKLVKNFMKLCGFENLMNQVRRMIALWQFAVAHKIPLAVTSDATRFLHVRKCNTGQLEHMKENT